jgi:hypothetical protein
MRKIILIGIFSILFFSSQVSAENPDWQLKSYESGTSVETTGTAAINEIRVHAALGLACNKDGAWLKFEIADYEKIQKIFDIRIFEGPNAPTRSLPLTTIELEGSSPVQSMSIRQNGFISVANRFVFETGGVALEQFYKRLTAKGNLFRIRIKSYRDPKQFIISEFPLSGSSEAIAEFAASCVDSKSQARKPARGK